jgi:hypothetical protein
VTPSAAPAPGLADLDRSTALSRELGLAASGLAPLGTEVGERIDGRADEHHRRAVLDGRA